MIWIASLDRKPESQSKSKSKCECEFKTPTLDLDLNLNLDSHFQCVGLLPPALQG